MTKCPVMGGIHLLEVHVHQQRLNCILTNPISTTVQVFLFSNIPCHPHQMAQKLHKTKQNKNKIKIKIKENLSVSAWS